MIRTKEWLVNQRIKYSLTQAQLALKSGVNKYTIENIEQGKRLGSLETWEKLEKFFNSDEVEVNYSYDCNDLIEEIKADIKECGEDKECYLFYKIEHDRIIFTNYDFIVEEKPLTEDDFKEGEKVIVTTLKYALEVFENQNKIFS